jgi:prepilin-type N-terminal cleavage/methylation domain-containing protein
MTNSVRRSATSRAGIARRRGMTLIEVILAVVILSGAMLGLADFGRRFQHQTSDSTSQTLASDLATQRIEQIKGWRVYSTLASTYNGVVENFGNSDATYSGFRRTTAAVACSGCPTATNDYVTITVTVTGRNLTTAIKKTTIIAAF